MKTNQLRLGNWIQGVRTFENGTKTNDMPMRVVSIFEDSIYADFEDNPADCWEYREGEFEGVPLDGDVLLKCGFKVAGENSKGEVVFRKNISGARYVSLSSKMEADRWIVDLRCYDNSICQVQTIHQLQNLYFALTGQELQTPNEWQ